MKNYVITDQLNPNAVSARYGRPKTNLGEDCVAVFFRASNDAEAFEFLDCAVESGRAGYSERNTGRIGVKMWRTKEFFNGGKPIFS